MDKKEIIRRRLQEYVGITRLPTNGDGWLTQMQADDLTEAIAADLETAEREAKRDNHRGF